MAGELSCRKGKEMDTRRDTAAAGVEKNPVCPEEYRRKARQAAAEGIVLLRNENRALPLKEGERIAVFGRSQFHYYKSGTGSGGMVHVDYTAGIYEALESCGRYQCSRKVRSVYEEWLSDHPFQAGEGWAAEPWFQEEMPLTKELAKEAARENDAALILIGRTAGEDQDNKKEPGSYLLTETERDMLAKVCGAFSRTIVLLNVGNLIDMSWVGEYGPSAVLYVWQGGQEGGNGVRDVLGGDVCPSGRLSSTIAVRLEDYPSTASFGGEEENIQSEDIYIGYRYFETFAREQVLYPFGFGLSYTSFRMETAQFQAGDGEIALEVKVTNTGETAGKEVVQVYCEMPQGKLGKPGRVLCGFAKTGLLEAGESETVCLRIPMEFLASYDDGGVTGYRSSYVWEKGTYRFYVGADVRSAQAAGCLEQKETREAVRCGEALAPVRSFLRMKPGVRKENGDYETDYETVPCRSQDPEQKRQAALPKELAQAADLGIRLSDVKEKKASMESFLGQLDDADLCCLVRGEGMHSPKVTPGIAGAFGGVTKRLRRFGIPVAGCADGPSGIRMDNGTHAFLIPCGTCLACTFDEALLEDLYGWVGWELRKNRIDMLLGPGMNIHRNPQNGRNFEYFSEDPLLTGKLAAACLRGLHRHGTDGVIKHFACNTQEYRRTKTDSVVSERAVREIYLKGFEIAVKEGQAKAVMSTYGPINGIWTASSLELLTQILRDEWGFDGIVMTDWGAMGNDGPGKPASRENVASQVRAQNDLNMVNENAEENSAGDNLSEALRDGSLTRGELLRCAGNICRYLMETPVFDDGI